MPLPVSRGRTALFATLLSALAPRAAHAQHEAEAAPLSEHEAAAEEAEPPRPYAFVLDARTVAPRSLELEYRANFGLPSGHAVLPIGAELLGHIGVIHELELEQGVSSHVSIFASGFVLVGLGDEPVRMAGSAELRARLVGDNRGPFQLTVSAGTFRDFSGYSTLTGNVAASAEFGRLRATANLVLEHSFAPGAEAVDYIVQAALAARVYEDRFWIAAEYVGADMFAANEGMGDDEDAALNGPRHLLGASTSVFLVRNRLAVHAGALFGLNTLSPSTTVRLSMAYAF